MSYSAHDIPNFDPRRRITLAGLALRLGNMIDPQILSTPEEIDARLGIDPEDHQRSSTDSIEAGIFVPKENPRYNTDQQIAIVNPATLKQITEKFAPHTLPFALESDKQPAVAFSTGDFLKFILSVGGLQRRAATETRHSNRLNTDSVEVDRRIKSSQAKWVEPYIEGVLDLDERYTGEADFLRSFLKLTHGRLPGRTPRNQYLARNLDIPRIRFDALYYQTIEAAAVTHGWTGKQTMGAHKADLRRRYMAPSQSEADDAWQEAIKLQGRYTTARRIKIMQAVDLYEAKIQKFIPYKSENTTALA